MVVGVAVVVAVVAVVPSRLRVPGSNARWMTNGSPGPGDEKEEKREL